MPMPRRELTDAERDEFITENNSGILCFAGEEPYGVPMGCMYKKGTVILGFSGSGRKLDYAKRNPKVCYTICRPRKTTPNLEKACTSVILEGELEEITDMAYYDMDKIPNMPEDIILFRIKVNKLGAKICLQEPCELLAGR